MTRSKFTAYRGLANTFQFQYFYFCYLMKVGKPLICQNSEVSKR